MEEMNFIQQLTIWALPVLFAITLHEVAHGWAALRCGDKTAYMLGRLSLNPINHIDVVGTILVPGLLLAFGSGILFGWAKPVPVDWNRLRKPRRDMMLVALAGPMANLLMVVFWAGLAKAGFSFNFNDSARQALVLMGLAGININLLIMIFNLLPLPPLDGSKLIMGLLPNKLAWQFSRIEPYGFIILMALVFTGVLNFVIAPAMRVMLGIVLSLYQIPI